MIEIPSYIQHLMAKFGHLKPAELSVAALEEYMKQHSSRNWRDKVLRPRFTWLAGTATRKGLPAAVRI